VEKKMEILPHEESIEALNHQFTEKNGANVAPIQVVEKPDGGYWVIDGMVRLNAAKSAGIEAIPVQLIKGISEDEIIFHIAKVQCLRRQNSDPVCLYFVKSLTDLAARRGKENQGQRNDLTSGRNRLEVGGNKFISQITGIGETKIKQAKKVLKNSELTKNVLSGGLTINGAFKEIKKAEKKDEQSAKSNSKARVTKLRTAVKEMSEGEIWEGLEGLSEDKLRFLQSKLEERLVAKND
jgi:hypothetical protein